MSNQNVYEYVVVLRAESAAGRGVGKDSILIGPKTIMARDEKGVERLAIRDVASDVDIAMVEVLVRPFVDC